MWEEIETWKCYVLARHMGVYPRERRVLTVEPGLTPNCTDSGRIEQTEGELGECGFIS